MVNIERLMNRLEELAQIGKTTAGGVERFSYTKEEKAANELVKQYMEAAGLLVEYDAVGNLIGTKAGTEDLPTILMGSHLDTVPNGGKYDGPVGVLSAIEVMQVFHEKEIQLKHPVKVIAFKDEEGARFGFGMIGSRAVSGKLTEADLKRVDANGISVEQAMIDYGLPVPDLSKAKMEQLKCYLEVHIEQGKVLEKANVAVGNVTGIAGPLWLQFKVIGESGHAGTTPMNDRRDALVGASLIIAEIQTIAKKYSDTVATVGQLTVKPNGINIIPGEVEFSVDLRDVDEQIRNQAEQEMKAFAEKVASDHGLQIEVTDLQRISPVRCDKEIQEAIKAAITEVGEQVISLPSGAGHDGMQLSDLCPIGMIFVQSKDGISHNPNEFSKREDIEKGAKVLYRTLLKIDED